VDGSEEESTVESDRVVAVVESEEEPSTVDAVELSVDETEKPVVPESDRVVVVESEASTVDDDVLSVAESGTPLVSDPDVLVVVVSEEDSTVEAEELSVTESGEELVPNSEDIVLLDSAETVVDRDMFSEDDSLKVAPAVSIDVEDDSELSMVEANDVPTVESEAAVVSVSDILRLSVEVSDDVKLSGALVVVDSDTSEVDVDVLSVSKSDELSTGTDVLSVIVEGVFLDMEELSGRCSLLFSRP
jgi:hypothetical protein